jgi:transcriptional regulator with XRE-family HTH domain
MSPFSDYLRELRLQRELRQTELAKLMGVGI